MDTSEQPQDPSNHGSHTFQRTHQDFFHPSEGSLADDLSWADVVIYASSTVGMEAVARGIPVVHLDLGDFVNMDPMHGLDQLNWSVSEPNQLAIVLQEMDSLSEPEYIERQRKGHQFVDNYFHPVTKESLMLFLEPPGLPKSQVK